MQPVRYERFDPLLSDAYVDALLELCEAFGSYGTYAEESVEDDIGAYDEPLVHGIEPFLRDERLAEAARQGFPPAAPGNDG